MYFWHSSNFFVPFLNMIILGKDEECGIEADKILLAYICLKAIFIGLRSILNLIWLWSSSLTWLFSALYLVNLWWMTAFYIVLSRNFFKDENDCDDRAETLEVGLILTLVEAFIIFTILCLIAGSAGIILPCAVVTGS